MAQRKPKKPKAPKASSPLSTWERYHQRLNDWKKAVAKIEADKKKKAALIQKARSVR